MNAAKMSTRPVNGKVGNNVQAKKDGTVESQVDRTLDGRMIKCSVGIAGCNGKVHLKCMGLDHLTAIEVLALKEVVCPLCFLYLQGDEHADKAMLDRYVDDLASCAVPVNLILLYSSIDVLTLNTTTSTNITDAEFFESDVEHSVWGYIDDPMIQFDSFAEEVAESKDDNQAKSPSKKKKPGDKTDKSDKTDKTDKADKAVSKSTADKCSEIVSSLSSPGNKTLNGANGHGESPNKSLSKKVAGHLLFSLPS
jgi:hypothetical protein